MKPAEQMDQKERSRSSVARDLAVFQVKLIVDGLKDLVLLPVSLLVGIVSIFGGGRKAREPFYDLLRLGKRSERWINLFGAATGNPTRPADQDDVAPKDLDAIVTRVEGLLVEECQKRGITVQARQRIDAALASLRSLNSQARK